ncbi:MAG: ABC transporter ATP-binding protein [Deltaproteobacteria bacterium]|nr:ABC transporter ATP-binding protein [Deltaproteobacteria bacterium]
MISSKELNVYYRQVHVLKDISFEIQKGEICSVVGANGAGKSTLINSLSRILPLKSGSISFNGEDISQYPPHRVVELGLIQVPEGRKLFPSLTVLENLELGAYQRRAKEKREDTLREVFSLFPILDKRRAQLAGTLSGGEQQMLALGRGLMSLPRLLMMDEPSLGLAPLIVKQMFNTIKQINVSGVTILLVEQNARKALAISDSGFVIENGKITISGKGSEIAENEHTRKAFLGL